MFLPSPLNWVLSFLLVTGGAYLMWVMVFCQGPTRDELTEGGVRAVLPLAHSAAKYGMWGSTLTAAGAAAAGGDIGVIILWVAIVFAALTLTYRYAQTAHRAWAQGVATSWVIFWWVSATLIVAFAAAASQMSNAAYRARTSQETIDVMRTATTTGVIIGIVGIVGMLIHLSRRRAVGRARRRPGNATRARLANSSHARRH